MIDVPDPLGSEQPRRRDASGTEPEDSDGRSRRWTSRTRDSVRTSGLVAALTLAFVSWMGQCFLSNREQEITVRMEQEQRTRLYTELMSRREESEAALRKDMFNTIVQQFFSGTSENTDVDSRLLRLEMLALNFGESLSLRPLFRSLEEDIESSEEAGGLRRDAQLDRLRGLAKRVSSWQLSALAMGGKTFTIEIPVDSANREQGYMWPDDAIMLDAALNPNAGSDHGVEDENHRGDIELQGIERAYSIVFTDADWEEAAIEVTVTVTELARDGEPVPGGLAAEAEYGPFNLEYFDFPMIDNTRLSGDQRFALVLEETNPEFFRVVGVVFHSLYSSQRNKPFLGEVIDQLRAEGRQ